MNPIRQLIRQVISEEFLQEDYESIQEIKLLANETLVDLAKINLDRVVEWATASQKKEDPSEVVNEIFFLGGEKPICFLSTTLYKAYIKSEKNFTKIKSFLEAAKSIDVNLIQGNSEKHQAAYSYIPTHNYEPETFKDIDLHYKELFIGELKKDVLEKLKEFKKYKYVNLYFKLHYPFISSLIHEIQHAYDDFRSNTKIFKTKENSNFKELEKTMESEMSKMEMYDKHEFAKKYLNLQHEVWARFSQTMNRVRFSEMDFAKTADGKDYFKSTMKPFDKLYKDFRYSFDGFQVLNKDAKNRLVRKLSQFWHIEEEKVKEANKNPETFE